MAAAEVFHWASVWLISAKINAAELAAAGPAADGEEPFGGGHLLFEVLYGWASCAYDDADLAHGPGVREILRPELDAVRRDGVDDPLAGVTAGRGDSFLLPGLGADERTDEERRRLRW